MALSKVLPKITFKMGSSSWGISILEGGLKTHIDFATLDRPGRRKARRMLISALEANGYFGKTRTASQRRS